MSARVNREGVSRTEIDRLHVLCACNLPFCIVAFGVELYCLCELCSGETESETDAVNLPTLESHESQKLSTV